MAKIYIARSDVYGVWEHSYYVYDPDGNPYSGDERIIRGGPAENGISTIYAIEADRPIANSRDALNGDDPYEDRYYTTVEEGTEQEMETIWEDMVEAATNSGDPDEDPEHEGQTIYIPPENGYYGVPPNCNTLTRTAGEAGGIDVMNNLPKVGGDSGGGDRMSPRQYVGIESSFNSSDGGTTTLEPGKTAIFDQGGADTYEYDPENFSSQDGPIYIYEDEDTGTVDKIVIEGVEPEQVRLERVGDDLAIYLPGDILPSMVIKGQFAGGVPKMNTLWIYPEVGDPEILPLNNPNDFPVGIPMPVGGWIPGVHDAIKDAEGLAVLQYQSPLVLDLGESGFALTNLTDGAVYWDIDIDAADGMAEASAWAGTEDGLLAIDLNEDGVINDSTELFGNGGIAANGFESLAAYDSNQDDHITDADDDWELLLVWVDENGDGYSQDTELHTLDELLITDIDLDYDAVDYTVNGNKILQESSFTIDGNTRDIADVWFAYDNVNTVYNGDYELDVRTLFLPTLRGGACPRAGGERPAVNDNIICERRTHRFAIAANDNRCRVNDVLRLVA